MFLPLVLLMRSTGNFRAQIECLRYIAVPQKFEPQEHGTCKTLLEYRQILEEVKMQKGWTG